MQSQPRKEGGPCEFQFAAQLHKDEADFVLTCRAEQVGGILQYGPWKDAPNPLQRWGSRGRTNSVICFMLLVGGPPLLAVGLATGTSGKFVMLAVCAVLFVCIWLASWALAPDTSQMSNQIVPYLPWFGSSRGDSGT